MNMVYRDYKSGDEYQILHFFRQVFGREMSLDFWRWRFVENPFGEGIIKLAFDGNTLIGHCAVIPMTVQVQGKSAKAVFSMTLMVHREYRDAWIFPRLARETYKVAAERGAKFVYGFPNANSYYPLIKLLNWEGLGKMSIWEKQMRSEGAGGIRGININQVDRFDGHIDSLWQKRKQKYPVIVPRTGQFLNWRFVNNPDVVYPKFVFANNEELLGYVVLKKYAAQDGVKGHIVDMLTIEDEEVVRGLLCRSYSYFAAQGISNLSCWCQDNDFYSYILGSEGFTRKEMEGTYFGIKILDKQDNSIKLIEHFPDWFLSMGDSDVF